MFTDIRKQQALRRAEGYLDLIFALADRCQDLIDDPVRRQGMATRARALAEAHPQSRNVEQIRGVYREVLELGIRPAPTWAGRHPR